MKNELEKQLEKFYDSLSSDYHLIYQNWEASIDRQSKKIDELIQKYSKIKAKNILDCTCGIGTQALGLSQLGYKVYGTDKSTESIKRAKEEAKKRNLSMAFTAVDLRELKDAVNAPIDVIISFDNSLPHILERKELLKGVENIHSILKTNNLFIGSVRDYDKLLEEQPKSTNPVISDKEGSRTITFQIWDWKEDASYIVNHFTLKEIGNDIQVKRRKVEYRAYSRLELTNIFKEGGFRQIDWLMPKETDFYQPIFVCVK